MHENILIINVNIFYRIADEKYLLHIGHLLSVGKYTKIAMALFIKWTRKSYVVLQENFPQFQALLCLSLSSSLNLKKIGYFCQSKNSFCLVFGNCTLVQLIITAIFLLTPVQLGVE